MISDLVALLVNALLPLTCILMFILMIRQSLRQNTDAKNSYRLWLLLPLCLVITLTPIAASIINEVIRFGGYGFNDSFTHNSIQAYIVKPTLTINQHLSHNVSIELTLFSIWLLGFSMLAGYWLTLHVDYQKKLMLKPASHHAFTQEIKKLNRSTNSLTLAQSSHVHSPMLMGLFKQTLVIPEDFNELYTPEQQQLIIAHEVCHFSHHHMWANQVALLLLALFWFHPLAWRAYAAFRQDQEHACDQFVLSRKQTQSRIEYCKALVVAAETSPPNAFTLMSFKHNGEQSFMFNRIEQIKKMDHKKPISKVAMLALVTLLSTSLVAGVTYASSQLKEAQKQDHKQFEVQPTHRIEPKYPIEAAKAGTEGSVVLKFDVLENGSVTNVEVVNAKPAYVFDKTAVTALKQWRYKASNKVTKNLLVQLDYVMDKSSTQPEPLIERIKVSH